MEHLEYNDPGSTRRALDLAGRSQSFTIILRGSARLRVLRGIDSYERFNDQIVVKGKKDLRIIGNFLWAARLAISFWSLCLYRDRQRKQLRFEDLGHQLVVYFCF